MPLNCTLYIYFHVAYRLGKVGYPILGQPTFPLCCLYLLRLPCLMSIDYILTLFFK